MRTPYAGRADLGDLVVNLTIENVDVLHWDGEIAGTALTDSFCNGPLTVTLLDQPRPGWSATAVAERHADGSGRLVGTGHFRSSWARRPLY